MIPSTGRPNFFSAFAMPFRGFGFVIRNPGLIRIWGIPVAIVFGFLVLGCAGGFHLGRVLSERWAPTPSDLGEFTDKLHWFWHQVARVLLTALGWAFSTALAVIFAPIVAAPFNEMLGEEVELRELGKPVPPFSWARLRRDLGRTVRLEATKVLLYLAIVVPITVAGFFSGPLSVLASGLAFAFTVAYFALDYIDGPLSRRNVGVRRRFGLITEHPAAMFGFGIGVWMLLLVPVLNLFFMPAAVVGGTRLCLRLGLLDQVDGDAPTQG